MSGRRSGVAVITDWWSQEVIDGIDREDVIARVREDAGWSAHFAVMTLLSAGIAILGLLLSSPAVVIGAMLISPLMGPIVGAGFAVATFDTVQIRRTLSALLAGTLLGLLFCAAIVLLSPIQSVTSEIASRTRPNLFDLLVALLAGLAGTYAVIRGRHGAIVGVAIATALMPPLAVMGFGLATANWTVLSGSALLFFTNLMTIAAAAAALARLYGFATDLSPHHTRLQLLILVGGVAVLAIPLGLSLKKIAWEAFATSEAKSAVAAAFGPHARVSDLQMSFDQKPIHVDATVLTPKYRKGVEQAVARQLDGRLGERVAVTVDQVHTSDGDAAAVDLKLANSSAAARESDRIAEDLAVAAGVPPDSILIDSQRKIAEVKASPLPRADLETYRELERRVAAMQPGWTIQLVPPALPLPALDDEETRDEAVETAVWAASRLKLPIKLSGPADDADAIEENLRNAGVAVHRSSGRRLLLQWDTDQSADEAPNREPT